MMLHYARFASVFSLKIRATLLIVLSLVAAGVSHAGTFVAVTGDRDGQAMTSVVIALKPVGIAAPVTLPATITVTQENLSFKPYISVVRKGSSVVFANRDTVEHHIKSFSSSRPFEIAVHKPGDTPPPIRFESEGAIVAYCILHDWMRAYVYVADTPWYGVSDTSGLTRIDNVPPGDYEVTAWHPDLGQFKPPLSTKVTISATGTAQSTFKFEFKPRPVRQAPKSTGVKTAHAHQHH
jgi:plastocyanin